MLFLQDLLLRLIRSLFLSNNILVLNLKKKYGRLHCVNAAECTTLSYGISLTNSSNGLQQFLSAGKHKGVLVSFFIQTSHHELTSH